MPPAAPSRYFLLLLAGLLAACSNDRGQGLDPGQESDFLALEGAPSPMDTMLHATIALAPVGESGIWGEAMAMHSENTVVVILEMQGLGEAVMHAAHIHAGTCATGGPVAVALSPVTGLEDGTGTSTTSLDAAELGATERYFIQVHTEDGTPAACGDMEGHGGS
jgi:hypothetical protein